MSVTPGATAGPPPAGPQPPIPASPRRVRPHAAWYSGVAVLWVAAVIFGALAIATLARSANDFRPVYGGVLEVPRGGVTVYATSKPTDHRCRLTGLNGDNLWMDGISSTYTATVDGKRLYAVANTPRALPPGSYTILCLGAGILQLWSGDRIDTGRIAVGGLGALVCGVLGLALLVVLLVLRHNSKSKIRRANLMAGPWPPTGPWPVGAYGGPPGGAYGQYPPSYGSGYRPPAYPQQPPAGWNPPGGPWGPPGGQPPYQGPGQPQGAPYRQPGPAPYQPQQPYPPTGQQPYPPAGQQPWGGPGVPPPGQPYPTYPQPGPQPRPPYQPPQPPSQPQPQSAPPAWTDPGTAPPDSAPDATSPDVDPPESRGDDDRPAESSDAAPDDAATDETPDSDR